MNGCGLCFENTQKELYLMEEEKEKNLHISHMRLTV